MRGRWIIGAVVVLAACSSDRDARPVTRPTSPPPDTSAPATTDGTVPATTAGTTSGPSTSSTSTTSTVPDGTITGVAVAGTAGGPEPSGPPFPQTDPFAETVRLADGTCVGWADSRAGSTAGLVAGAPITILDVEGNQEIGTGTITASRWEDMAAGGEQWNCLFDFTATVTGAPAEFRVKVGGLEPWLARPDPTAPTTFVASVNSNASIGLIPSCPPVPEEPSSTTSSSTPASTVAPTTTVPGPPVSGWNAVGQYWSRGVDALCAAGLPVTAIARPCRPAGAGSEYITEVSASDDPTVIYTNGAAIPAGTALTVKVATGRLC